MRTSGDSGRRSTILFRPLDGRRFKQFHQACELLDLPRERRRQGLILFKQGAGSLVSTDLDFHPGPVDLRVRLRGSRWIQLLAPAAIPDAAETALRCRALEAIVIERDESARRTSIRIATAGKTVATFSATGPVDGAMTQASLKATPRFAKATKDHSTIADVQAALLRILKVKPRELTVERRDDKTFLRAADGRPLRVGDVDAVYLVEYEPVSAAESPASVALHAAIDRADPAAVRKAIRNGARLDYLPGLMTSPLDWALTRRKGRWLDCVKALVDAGAPLDGGRGGDPAIIVAVDVTGAKASSTTELIDYLLKMGVSLETRGQTSARGGMTPLHVAAADGMLGVVAYLVSRGADVHATVGRGLKASDLSRPSHTFLGDEHALTRKFLLAAERGAAKISPRVARALAEQADRWRDGVKDAVRNWATATKSPLAALFATAERDPVAERGA